MKNFILMFIAISIFLIKPAYSEDNMIQSAGNYNSSTASVYDFNTMPINQLTDKIGMRFLTSCKLYRYSMDIEERS